MPTHLTEDDVAHIAELARLELSDADRTRMTGQLGDILAYAATVQEADTTGIPPAADTIRPAETRADEAAPSLSRPDFMRDAPDGARDAPDGARDAPDGARDAGLFRVPKVL